MFVKQFIGKATWRVLASIAVMHLLAFFVRDTSLEAVALIAAAVGTFWLAQRELRLGVLIAFAEIFVGGHGHLFAMTVGGFSVSLRMAIFGAVMAAWLWQLWTGRITVRRNVWRELPFVILMIAIFSAFIQGVVANGAGAAFDDMNGYMSILYLLPLMSIEWTGKAKRSLLQMFAGSTIWIAAFSLALLYIFTHVDGKTLHVLYAFVRDSRLAEVTLQVIDNKGADWEVLLNRVGTVADSDYFYRIFMPAQSTVMMALLLCWSAMLFMYRDQRLPAAVGWGMVASYAVLFMSLSRSFLLGAFVGMVMLWIISLIRERKRWVTIRRSLLCAVYAAVSLAVVWALVAVPFPTRPDLTDASFYETSSNTGRTEAVVSRWTLLDPMMEAIAESPLIGQGFGATVTYTSSDPRIINETGGAYTTYRFEWGWHDIWMKMGFFGLLAFLTYLVILTLTTRFHVRKHSQDWLTFGLFAGILALFVTHIFSPYLNHPIGIAWMLFVLPFLDTPGWGKTIEARIRPQQIFDKQKQAVVVSRLVKKQTREN